MTLHELCYKTANDCFMDHITSPFQVKKRLEAMSDKLDAKYDGFPFMRFLSAVQTQIVRMQR